MTHCSRAGTIRASRYGRVKDYHTVASDEICLLVQIETQQGLDNLDEIAAVDGVNDLHTHPDDSNLCHVANSRSRPPQQGPIHHSVTYSTLSLVVNKW
jgi:2-keto-3-deoxy-L-rhamnonate aldolase RhmA